MQNSNAKTAWVAYCTEELALLTPLIARHGFTLGSVQPHLKGERYLMNAVTTASGQKLILLGTNAAGTKVIIKASREKNGIREINHERTCREILTRIDFARDVFHTPREVAYIQEEGFTVSINEFIEQPSPFLARPLAEQFAFALTAFKAQEGAHATTYKHYRLVSNTFGVRDADTYLNTFASFKKNITLKFPHETKIIDTLCTAFEVLTAKENVIEQYCGFLTHTDFVPHNFRINNDTMYLLDHSSLTFGNKYEGWARFINFMALHNPSLQKALEQYVRDNRTREEQDALRIMRIYRLGEIIWYYVRSLEQSDDSLLELNTSRIYFWRDVLACVLNREEVPEKIILAYTQKRDLLRSEEEKERQQGLH